MVFSLGYCMHLKAIKLLLSETMLMQKHAKSLIGLPSSNLTLEVSTWNKRLNNTK